LQHPPGTDHIIDDAAIEHDVWVGPGATVLPGIRISESCIVTAGAEGIEGTYLLHIILTRIFAVVVKAHFAPAETTRGARMQAA
jgi:acetyltransferase-like isoleucine patch superfamily enzyme